MSGLQVYLARFAYVPFMILGLNGAAYYVVASGHSYAWLAPLLAIAFAASFLAERALPCHEEWNHSHGDAGANVWHAIVYESSSLAGVLMIPLVSWLLQLKPGSLIGLWPREWPLPIQLLMAIVIADLAFMIIHYLSHRWPILWRLHAVHHGVSRLYGFNGLVRHPLHQMLDMALGTAPLVLLGMPLEIAVLLGFAVSVQLIVQHSNVDYALGPFRGLLSIGPIHHLHHVNWGKEGDCNFALFLTLGDRLLGTYVPEPPRPIKANDMGIDDMPEFPKSYLQQLVFPFTYKPGSGQPDALVTRPAPAGPAE